MIHGTTHFGGGWATTLSKVEIMKSWRKHPNAVGVGRKHSAYFLGLDSQEMLTDIMFPLGEMKGHNTNTQATDPVARMRITSNQC